MKRPNPFKVVQRTPRIDRSPHKPKVSPFVDDPIPPAKAAFFRRIMGFHLRTSTIT